MPSTKDIILGKKLMILLIGKNGHGKTCQVASFSDSGPGKIFDFDGRMDSIKAVFPEKDIEYQTYGVFDDEERGIVSLDRFLPEFVSLAKECPYKWVCIDSLTSLSTALVNYQMIMKGEKGKTTKGMISIPSWDEFNGEAMEICRMLDVCRMIPAHVILTAHPVIKADVNNPGKLLESIVSFGIKVPNLVPGYFNEIFFLDIEQSVNASKPPNRVVYTKATPGIFAKTTLPLESKIILEDNGPGLYQVIQESLKK